MTYDSWYRQYMTLYKTDIAPKTAESYEHCYATYIAPTLAASELEAVTPDDLQSIVMQAFFTAGSRQAQIVYAQLHAVFARAARSRRIGYNPADCIDKPQHAARQGRAINAEEWQQLASYIRDDIGLSLAAYAGLRRGEILGLERRDVDLVRGQITIQRQRLRVAGKLITSTPKSNAGNRIVPICADLAPIIQRRAHQLTPNGLICPMAPETLNHHWRRAQQEAGIEAPYRLHDLRHTYATQLVAAGCNIKTLQYLMGHSTYQLTADTYTHINAEQARAELQRVGAL